MMPINNIISPLLYNFDYLIVSKTDNLYNHLKKDTDYEVVFQSKDKKTFLFKRNIVK